MSSVAISMVGDGDGIFRNFLMPPSQGDGEDLDFLGLADDDNRLMPATVSTDAFGGARVLQAAGGGAFSAAVTERGGLYAFGEGGPWLGLGEAGPDFSAPQRSPTAVSGGCFGGDRVVMTSCGAMHQCALTDTGDVYCWGQGGPRLGQGDAESRAEPTKIGQELFGGCAVALVACGGVHTAAVTRAGALYTWGFGGEGRLGLGDTALRMVPTLVTSIGQRFGTGPLRARVMTVAGGGYHTAAITEDGHLWTWGQGLFAWRARTRILEAGRQGGREGGRGGGRQRHRERERKRSNLCVRATERRGLGAAGRDGALGHQDRECKLLPTKVAPPPGCSSGWAANVSCGSFHTAAVSDNGDVYTWGKGEHGCLGHGDAADRLEPSLVRLLHDQGVKIVQAASGHSHMLATSRDGNVWSWGYGKTGALGSSNSRHSLVPLLIESHLFGYSKTARISSVPPLLALAFASLTHSRLGQDSEYAGLLPELVERIFKFAWPPAWPQGLTKEHEGIARLIGALHTPDHS